MRIAIDARMSAWGGVGRYTAGLLQGLSEVDSENEYFLLTSPDDEASLPKAPNFTFIPARKSVLSPGGYREAGRLASEVGANLFHALHYFVPLGFYGKLVVTVHDLIPLDYPASMPSLGKRLLYRFLMDRAVQRADALVTVSGYTLARLGFYYPSEANKARVIHAGLASHFFDNSSQGYKGSQKPYILTMGNPKAHKNLAALVEAFARLVEEDGFTYELVLVGSVDDGGSEVSTLISRLDLGDRIMFTGSLDDGELIKLYRGAAVFVFPSLYEGFGFPPLEAMAAGTPVVCSDRASLPEVCGEACLLVKPDSASLAAGIGRLLGDTELRERLAKHGRAQAEKFSWVETASKTVELYRSLLESGALEDR